MSARPPRARRYENFQQTLAFLTNAEAGAHGYDPAHWRTKAYPAGRFDGGAVMDLSAAELARALAVAGGGAADELAAGPAEILFDADSFALFGASATDGGLGGGGGEFADRIYFVTRKAALNGLGSKLQAQILRRLASDARAFPLENDDDRLAMLAWACAEPAGADGAAADGAAAVPAPEDGPPPGPPVPPLTTADVLRRVYRPSEARAPQIFVVENPGRGEDPDALADG